MGWSLVGYSEGSFVEADLREASFPECIYRGADFRGARLEGANFEAAKKAADALAERIGGESRVKFSSDPMVKVGEIKQKPLLKQRKKRGKKLIFSLKESQQKMYYEKLMNMQRDMV